MFWRLPSGYLLRVIFQHTIEFSRDASNLSTICFWKGLLHLLILNFNLLVFFELIKFLTKVLETWYHIVGLLRRWPCFGCLRPRRRSLVLVDRIVFKSYFCSLSFAISLPIMSHDASDGTLHVLEPGLSLISLLLCCHVALLIVWH